MTSSDREVNYSIGKDAQMKEPQVSYRSLLLRLWRETDSDFTSWRMVVLDPHSGDRWGFTDPIQLANFINTQIFDLESNTDKVFHDQGGHHEQNSKH
jgi:hypothetical protein